MVERYIPSEPDARLEEIDEQLMRCHAPGSAESLVAGRIFEASRVHLQRAGASDGAPLRLADEDGPSMLPTRSWSAWPILAAMAAMVVVATLIAVLYSVQAARNNYADPLQQMAAETAAPSRYSAVDDAFEGEFSVATGTLMSDITASVDSLVTSSSEWAYGSLSSELQTATSNLWEDMNSF